MSIHLRVHYCRQISNLGHIAIEVCDSESKKSEFFNWPDNNSEEELKRSIEFVGDAVSIDLPEIDLSYSAACEQILQLFIIEDRKKSNGEMEKVSVQFNKRPYDIYNNNCAQAVLVIMQAVLGQAVSEISSADLSKFFATTSPLTSNAARIACDLGLHIAQSRRKLRLEKEESPEKIKLLLENSMEILQLEISKQRASHYSRGVEEKQIRSGHLYAISKWLSHKNKIKDSKSSGEIKEHKRSASMSTSTPEILMLAQFMETNAVFNPAASARFFNAFYNTLSSADKVQYQFNLAINQLTVIAARLQEAGLKADCEAVNDLRQALEGNFAKLQNNQMTKEQFYTAMQSYFAVVQTALTTHPYSVTAGKNTDNMMIVGVTHGVVLMGTIAVGFTRGYDDIFFMDNFSTIIAGLIVAAAAMIVAQATISLLSLLFVGSVLPVVTATAATVDRLDALTDTLDEMLNLHREPELASGYQCLAGC